MAVKSSIHIKPCNISSSEAHNLRTPEYMRNIGESKIYLIPQLVADNEYWINSHLGDYDLQTHYNNIKQMVKAKTGRAMQEKERERKTKSGKIVKVAGCSPIREGVLLIKPDTTLEDVRRFGEECQQRWGITPLQIFLHKDEGHWLGGEPAPDDKESFQIGGRWFKPNYHAHIVWDWMNHDTGKSCKLLPQDMSQMQTILADARGMERGTLSSVRDENGKDILADVELLRLAFPRRVFTLSQVKYVADRMKWLYDNRDLIGGLEFVEEPPVLRFFMGKLRAKSDWPEKLAAKYRRDFGESL